MLQYDFYHMQIKEGSLAETLRAHLDVIDDPAQRGLVERALKRYAEHLKYPEIHPRVREVLTKVTHDEGWHVDWMRKKGQELSRETDNPNHFDEKYETYSKIDEEVWAELESKEIAW